MGARPEVSLDAPQEVWKWLRKMHLSALLCRDVGGPGIPKYYQLPSVIVLRVNVLGTLMGYWILSDGYSSEEPD